MAGSEGEAGKGMEVDPNVGGEVGGGNQSAQNEDFGREVTETWP